MHAQIAALPGAAIRVLGPPSMKPLAIALAALLAAPAIAAAAPICMGQLYGLAVPHKGKPATYVDWARTDNGRVVWGFCQPDPTQRASMWAIVCKHGTCDMSKFIDTLDTARRSADVKTAAIAAWDGIFSAGSPKCYLRDAAGALVVDEALADAQFRSACGEALALILASWPDAPPAPTPPPPPPPLPPPAAYVVAPTGICAAEDKANGVCVRRQSFTWDGAARGLVAQPERATIGAPCIASIGAAPYFGFDASRTDRVVACLKK